MRFREKKRKINNFYQNRVHTIQNVIGVVFVLKV